MLSLPLQRLRARAGTPCENSTPPFIVIKLSIKLVCACVHVCVKRQLEAGAPLHAERALVLPRIAGVLGKDSDRPMECESVRP